jgi:LacI family transcriptional regulator
MARPRAKHVTVRAIAAEAGVSIATVSRVINGHVTVAPETQDLVRRAMERLQPAPAPARPGAVYVRCPYVLTDYFGVIVTSIADTLALHGRDLVLGAGESAQSAHVLTALPRNPAIAASPSWSSIRVPRCRARSPPSRPPTPPGPAVSPPI